jgi:Xaa-Pro aminopeptidase
MAGSGALIASGDSLMSVSSHVELISPSFDIGARWARAAELMEAKGIDALFLMKPANLAYLTGDGRPCALGLLTKSLHCVVSVPASDLPSVRKTSAAADIRTFKSEEEMLHGFRDVLKDLHLSEATEESCRA